jgi:putative aminopeptidase FrvX
MHRFRPVAWLLFALCVAVPVPAKQAPPVAVSSSWSGLAQLAGKPAVSGFETEVRDAIRAQLPAWARSRTDEAGNLIVTFGEGAPHVLVCADMDEDGYFVSGITEEGYLRLHRVTTGVTNRLFEQMHYGQPIFIETRGGGHVNGVIATASTHLQRGRDPAATPKGVDDLWVDVGARSRADIERLGIRMLDPISLRERVQSLAAGRLAGVAAQTRGLDYALLAFASRLDPKSVTGTVTIAWTARGSFGERGMARLAQEVNPDRIIVLTRAAMPRDGNNPKGAVGELGGGALVVDSDAKTIEIANQRDVPVQAVANVLRAPNVWPAAKTQTFGVPILYAQTPVETVDARDADSLARLLGAATGLTLRPAESGIPGGIAGGVPLHSSADIIATLRPLVGATAVSGAEGPVRDIVLKQLPKWAKPQVDGRGNVTVSFGQPASAAPAGATRAATARPRRRPPAMGASEGGGGRELLFVAHMDEIGYAITDIRDDGTASVAKRGGFFDYLWEAHPVFVQTAKGPVPAVVAPRPGYLNATTATPRAEDIVLYFGTASRAETQALGVAKGDTATIRKELMQLAGSRWTARSMDDRCGVATLIAALNRIDPAKVSNRVTFAFVVGEETGLVGSGFLAERLHPTVAFAVDTFVSSDSPVDPQRLALVPLGSGAVARAIDSSSMTPPDAVARIVSIGGAHRIPVVVSATSGGNDGSQFGRYGSIVAPLSWPGRYSHSPVEVMDLRDLENLVGLVVALAHEF